MLAMSHHSTKSAYYQLQERLNRFPQGAPPSETMPLVKRKLKSTRILHWLWSMREELSYKGFVFGKQG
jgi:hypothetical protein